MKLFTFTLLSIILIGCVTDSQPNTHNVTLTLVVDSTGRDTADDMVSLDY